MRRALLLCWMLLAAWPAAARTQADGAEPPKAGGPAPAAAEAAKDAVCTGNGLMLREPAAGASFRLRDTVYIVATSEACRARLEVAHQQASARPVRLFLDDVEIRGTDARIERDAQGAWMVALRLDRDASNADNRQDWTRMLSKPGQGYTLQPSLALAFGTDPPLHVSGEQGRAFQLTIVRRGHAMLALAAGLAVFLGAFIVMVRNPSLLRDAPGGHYSLGRTQMAFWGLLVFLCWLGVWLLTQTLEYIPNQTLLLMGISAATGLAAAFIGKAPADRQALLTAEAGALNAKAGATPPVALTPAETVRLAEIGQDLARLRAHVARPPSFWRDVCDDGSGPSFQRVQVVVWTCALGVVFVASVATTMAMPEFSETLLLLMGLSNGTYLGFKFNEKA